MTTRIRENISLLTALALVTTCASLAGCMPEAAPVGNPERTRIDTDLNGVWVFSEEAEATLVFFEPWDKRTWSVYIAGIESGDEALVPEESLDSYDGIVAGLKARSEEDTRVLKADDFTIYKAWLTKIGRETFLVWEPKGILGDREDEQWGVDAALNWRITRPGSDDLALQFINYGHDEFKDVDLMDRKSVEKVLRRHADADGIFEEDLIPLERAKSEDIELFAQILEDVIDH